MTAPIRPRRTPRVAPPPAEPAAAKSPPTDKSGKHVPAARADGVAGLGEDVVVPHREDRMMVIGTSHEVIEPREASDGEPTGKRSGDLPVARLDSDPETAKKKTTGRPDRKGPPPPVIPGRPPKAGP